MYITIRAWYNEPSPTMEFPMIDEILLRLERLEREVKVLRAEMEESDRADVQEVSRINDRISQIEARLT